MNKNIIVLLLIISNNLFSQKINFENLGNYLNYIENNNLGAGSVSIFKDGEEIYNKDFGQKNIPDLVYNNTTKYQIGSVTKLITATLIYKLIEKKKLRINDKLSDFYPEIPNSEKITIKNLLEHTSGLGSYVVKEGQVWVTEKVTEKEIFNLIIKQGVSFEPNEKVAYSNTAYYLLTKIIEKKYKKPFHKVFTQEIAQPLKLRNLVSIKSNPKNVFKPYHYKMNKWQELEKEIDFFNVIGVGDMASTPKDLNIFINNLFQNKIIKKESLEMMLPSGNTDSWGRGIATWMFDGIVFYGHGGDTLGSHALLIYNKDENLSIAYTTNGERIRKEEFTKDIIYSLYDKDFDFPIIK
ncbi:beta-lactamase family protein [Flavobacterium covae]|uniref:serine hydrolase domain-containing protein n=1 Tax=Flavobacterium covae TaxID=2906076 RepID=UPI001FB6C714|nr:serine hydrolase domain-containing protein [Flavobacterium covae]MCJ1805942.1 beta-lactamase family protein [Flavobacterium covae]